MHIDYKKHCPITALIGKTLTEIRALEKDSDSVIFVCDDGTEFTMFHQQDCCEGVSIDDVEGDVTDLIGRPLTVAEEVNNLPEPPTPEGAESHTWTFYRLATDKGFVVIRWYGESNGYYSESVNFAKLD